MNQIEEKVAQIFSLLLDAEIRPSDDVSMANCDLWDSMKHIEIITTLEEELDVSFEPQDIPQLTSLSLILSKLKEIAK